MTDLSDSYGLPARLLQEKSATSTQDLSRLMAAKYSAGALFRGLSDADYGLETRLRRTFSSSWKAEERRMQQIFESDASEHLSDTGYPQSRLDWLSYIQHHGGPTRLLDWSQSPYIAMYFACESRHDRDGAVWTTDIESSTTASRHLIRQYGVQDNGIDTSSIVDFAIAKDIPIFLPLAPRHRFRRMTAQAGVFTAIGADACVSVATAELASECKADMPAGRPFLSKTVIPAELKPKVLDMLGSMNIHEATIYPGLDGLARSLVQRPYVDPFFA